MKGNIVWRYHRRRSFTRLFCFKDFCLFRFRHYNITAGYRLFSLLFSLLFYDCFHWFRFLHLLHNRFLCLYRDGINSHS